VGRLPYSVRLARHISRALFEQTQSFSRKLCYVRSLIDHRAASVNTPAVNHRFLKFSKTAALNDAPTFVYRTLKTITTRRESFSTTRHADVQTHPIHMRLHRGKPDDNLHAYILSNSNSGRHLNADNLHPLTAY
jgi:hypothetical protein